MISSFVSLIVFIELLDKSLLFHFETCPDERTHALGIVVADRLAHIVFEAAIALVVGLLDVWARARAQAAYCTAACQTDGLVGVYLDKLFQDTIVCLHACLEIFLREVALAVNVPLILLNVSLAS